MDDDTFITSKDMIEIDITYRCDLKCLNCDRSCRQAEAECDMSLRHILKFVEESEAEGYEWNRIRIMGGEPLLHPDIGEIMKIFSYYGKRHPNTLIELFTNGIEKNVPSVPDNIEMHNTRKADIYNEKFEPYNLAPVDLNVTADYRKGCWITSYCGMGLNIYGYYPCAAGAAVDRVFGFDIGSSCISKAAERFEEQKDRLCRYCGHFLSRKYVGPNERMGCGKKEMMSKSWKEIYARYQKKRPRLTVGGSDGT